MANENFRVLETVGGIDYIFDCKTFRDELRRMSRISKQTGVSSSVEEYRENFADKINVSASALKQWESGRNGVSDLERVKEIAQHLFLDDYRKLLVPKSDKEEMEFCIMRNGEISDKERDVARELFGKFVDYISTYIESDGFKNFDLANHCSSDEELVKLSFRLENSIKRGRFDVPKYISDQLYDLYLIIGFDEINSDLSGVEKSLSVERYAAEYYDSLCNIMCEYLK